MGSMLDEIAKTVESMTEEELRAEFIKAQADRSARKEKQLAYNADPENKAKRLAYQKQRNELIKTDPAAYAKLTEKRKAYMSRPDVKDKQKAYRVKRNEMHKLILARAKQLGIHEELLAAAKAAVSQKSA